MAVVKPPKELWTAVESNHHQPQASSTRGHSAIELAARVAAIVFTDGWRLCQIN